MLHNIKITPHHGMHISELLAIAKICDNLGNIVHTFRHGKAPGELDATLQNVGTKSIVIDTSWQPRYMRE
jgi:hypothetical protein